jgi:hypothetical protein
MEGAKSPFAESTDCVEVASWHSHALIGIKFLSYNEKPIPIDGTLFIEELGAAPAPHNGHGGSCAEALYPLCRAQVCGRQDRPIEVSQVLPRKIVHSSGAPRVAVSSVWVALQDKVAVGLSAGVGVILASLLHMWQSWRVRRRYINFVQLKRGGDVTNSAADDTDDGVEMQAFDMSRATIVKQRVHLSPEADDEGV